MPITEDYGLPPGARRGLPPLRMWAVMLAIPVAALVLWRLLPDSPVTVALLVIAVLAAVAIGVSWVLRSRALSQPPDRDPRPTR
jgi:membrane protein implicated in regulation of membrane protease activity